MSEKKIPQSEWNVLRSGSQKKLMSLLGFAARARKLVCGTDLCRDEIRRGNLSFVIVADNASANTKKRNFLYENAELYIEDVP